MNKESLNIAQAEEALNNWIINNQQTPKIEKIKYRIIRNEFISHYNEIRRNIKNNPTINSWYTLDAEFGLFLYTYFKEQNWFTMRYAEDDGFWRFLSVQIFPDLVANRWDINKVDHFYSRSTRIWLKSLWWYVHLSWQGTLEDTRKVVLSSNMSTDTIQNLVERSGRNGVYIDVYRKIMKYYSKLTTNELKDLEKSIKENKTRDTFFRNIMKLNTAKIMLVEPGLFDGGETGYVKSLFKELGAKINEA